MEHLIEIKQIEIEKARGIVCEDFNCMNTCTGSCDGTCRFKGCMDF